MKNNNSFYHFLFLFASLCISSELFAQNTFVDIVSNKGIITVQLSDDKAPATVANFLTYVEQGFYENTLFHRVIRDFMIQGGGYDANTMTSKPTHQAITLESNTGLSNLRGTIAMARQAEPNTATTQFFINTVDNTFLDYQDWSNPGYAVFGQITDGMNIVDNISEQKTNNIQLDNNIAKNAPIDPIIIDVIRLRQGQLSFVEQANVYSSGETIRVQLEERQMERQSSLDLWVAVISPENRLIFVTDNSFTDTPSAFQLNVPATVSSHAIFNFTIPEGLSGNYTLLAIFNQPGSDLSDLKHSLRSNIAQSIIEIK
ncbi:MAG: peptidylprolyl isomerase [Methyloprofundus sp.]|nr:peptidylprolyl isomerase [Methyloprofundus sp.]